MIGWLKENRLKLVSILCVLGDMLMGVAGAVGLYHLGKNFADLLMTGAAFLGLFGHSIVIIWGKGGEAKHGQVHAAQQISIFLKPLFMWRYPLDASFAVFSVGGFIFAIAGATSHNPPLVLFGVIGCGAALLGWLWPQDRPLFGFRSLQVCAILYTVSGIASIASGLWAHSLYIFLAGCCYISANIIFSTVRKQNQSQYTIDQV